MKIAQFQYTVLSGWSGLEEAKKIDCENTLILAFCSPLFKEQAHLFVKLKSQFPRSLIIGCSTSGEILKDRIFDNSISCTAISFEESYFKLATKALNQTSDSLAVGSDLAQELLSSDLKGAYILSDGLIANGSALAEGFNSIVDSSRVSVAGGLAGDGSHFKNTWVLVNDKILSNTVVSVGFYGENLKISSASKGGWDIFGPERLITRSIDNVVYEIDGKPALDLYKEYLGEKSKTLPASGLLFPIQIRRSSSEDKRLVRTILAIDETAKSLIFAGDMPKGYLAQLMRANFDRVIDGASAAAEIVKNHSAKFFDADEDISRSVCLAVSCVGRRLVLGQRSEEEVEALTSCLDPQVAVAGFYSYGELAPSAQGSPCDLHNQSMTLMNIYELKSKKKKIAA